MIVMKIVFRIAFLLHLCLAVAVAVAVANAVVEDCELGDDGTCINRDDGDCVDTHEKCSLWESTGECDANPNYMLRNCQKSCKTCGMANADIAVLAVKRFELYEVGGDETLLENPYGMNQEYDDETKEKVEQVIANYSTYMEEKIFADPKSSVKKTCKNRHRQCAFWTALGECEVNKVYMQKFCAPACQTCHFLDFKHRCPIDETIPEALQPGDLNKMFTRLTTDEYYQQFEPQILSAPSDDPEKDGPWVVVFDKLLTEEECNRLIELGALEGYKESADVGKKNFDGTYDKSVNNGRTSTNAWCGDICMADDVAKTVNARISNLTGIPEPNAEYLQLLRYEPGQFYNTHHDYIPHHTERQMGVRTLTVFLYLNDVEAGGGTEFPNLGLTVMPKRGKAVIWPSVFDQNPNAKDLRTEHGALPVEKGIKYGANAWIHQRDFKGALKRGCI